MISPGDPRDLGFWRSLRRRVVARGRLRVTPPLTFDGHTLGVAGRPGHVPVLLTDDEGGGAYAASALESDWTGTAYEYNATTGLTGKIVLARPDGHGAVRFVYLRDGCYTTKARLRLRRTVDGTPIVGAKVELTDFTTRVPIDQGDGTTGLIGTTDAEGRVAWTPIASGEYVCRIYGYTLSTIAMDHTTRITGEVAPARPCFDWELGACADLVTITIAGAPDTSDIVWNVNGQVLLNPLVGYAWRPLTHTPGSTTWEYRSSSMGPYQRLNTALGGRGEHYEPVSKRGAITTPRTGADHGLPTQRTFLNVGACGFYKPACNVQHIDLNVFPLASEPGSGSGYVDLTWLVQPVGGPGSVGPSGCYTDNRNCDPVRDNPYSYNGLIRDTLIGVCPVGTVSLTYKGYDNNTGQLTWSGAGPNTPYCRNAKMEFIIPSGGGCPFVRYSAEPIPQPPGSPPAVCPLSPRDNSPIGHLSSPTSLVFYSGIQAIATVTE